MPKLTVKFNLGVQPPAKLGTLILKLAAQGKLSYAQNVEAQNDEYGNAALVPGPALVTITGNSTFTGVPFLKALYTDGSAPLGWLYVASGLLGATNKIFRIQDVEPGETPSVDTGNTGTVAHSGHSSVEITDMVYRNSALGTEILLVGKDATDGWIQKFTANNTSISPSAVTTLTSFNTGRVPKMFLASNGNIYIGHGFLIDSLSSADSYSANALSIPMGYGVTGFTEWQLRLVIAYNTDFPHSFTQRKSGGRSGLLLWNMLPSSSFERDIACPARYISAVVNDPDGSLLVFGGVDEGKSTIYNFNGFGFTPLYSYIGDLPRSRHSVDFDEQGRVLFTTADGQICRFDKRSGLFEHLGSITTDTSAGGLFTRLVGGSGNEFLAASGNGSTYTCKRVTFGSYIGDGAAGPDGITTPLAVSGLQFLPPRSTITAITLYLAKSLAANEKITLRVYKNGSTTPTDYMDMAHSSQGAINQRRLSNIINNVNNFALGVVWKQTDALATAPPVMYAEVEYDDNL